MLPTLRLGTLAPLLLLFPFAAAILTPVAAQETGPPFSDRVDVNLVEVEVVVTDRGGERVTGLGREDFRLTVGDRPVEIEFFEEVRRPGATPDTGVIFAVDTHSGETTAPGRSFLLYLDDVFTDPQTRHRLLKRLERDLSDWQPGDRFAAVRYVGRGLEPLTDWTTDPAVIAASLRQARKARTAYLERLTLGTRNPDGVLTEKIFGEEIENSASALEAALGAYADAPGRRVLLFVGSGWPYTQFSAADNIMPTFEGDAAPLEDDALTSAIEPRTGVSALGARSYRSFVPIRNAIDTANRLGYTIYPFSLSEMELTRQSLRGLARHTGGRIAGDGATVQTAWRGVLDDTARHYVLAFSGGVLTTGERAEIRVETLRPGLTLRHRLSVIELSDGDRAELQTARALLGGSIEEAGNLEVTLPTADRRGRTYVQPVEIRIPLDFPLLQPARGGKARMDLELRVAAIDRRGERSPMPVVPVELRIPAPPEDGSLAGEFVVYETAVALRSDTTRLALTLRDTRTGESRSAALRLDP